MEFLNELTKEKADGPPENIWIASSDGDIESVTMFLKDGVQVNIQDENGYSPIHAAVSYGHVDLIELLVANGADINLRDTDGDTPLLLCEEPEILDKILQLGANIADVNYSGESLFEKAVEDENDLLIQKLVDIGVISNEQATQALDTINGNVDPMEQYKIDEDEDMEASNP